MIFKHKITTAFYLILYYVFLGTIFYGNHDLMFPLTLAGAFILGVIFLKKESKAVFKKSMLLFCPFVFLLLIASLLGNDFSRSVLYIIFVPFFILFGYSFNKSFPIIKTVSVVMFIAFLSVYVYPSTFLLLNKSKSSYERTSFPEIFFFNEANEKILFNKKYTVLDFWTTNCSICYTKFPYLDKMNKKYSSNQIAFYSVHVAVPGEDFASIKKNVDSLDYSYETIYAKSIKDVKELLGINAYPHLLILEGDEIIYSGWMITKKNIFGDNLEEQIVKLLK